MHKKYFNYISWPDEIASVYLNGNGVYTTVAGQLSEILSSHCG